MKLKTLKRTIKARIETCRDQMALSAVAVSRDGQTIVIPGLSDVGKSTLAAWFISKGYRYLTDKLVFFHDNSGKMDCFSGPMILHGDTADRLLAMLGINKKVTQKDQNKIIVPESELPGTTPDEINTPVLILYPQFKPGADIALAPLSSGQATAELMSCTLNARMLPKHGFTQAAELSRKIPACKVIYSDFDQFEDVLDSFIKLTTAGNIKYDKLRQLTKAFGGSKQNTNRPATPAQPASTTQSFPIPAPTPKRKKRKLTIGMATYDDFDGVYFSVQAIRMYHPEVTDETEIIVVDNNPQGVCAKYLKALDKTIKGYRYVPFNRFRGTAICDQVFREANADLVMVMDGHVFIDPGAIKKLIAYFNDHPDSKDLLQGPMVTEGLASVLTHWNPIWGGGMYGKWARDDRGNDPNGEPFEIPMQGLALFACRKAVWPGYNPRFSGFGGAGGYIHEKFRQRDGKVLCMPFLRWLHRFPRPQGAPYPLNWKDRIYNFHLGFNELGLDTDQIDHHFSEHLGAESYALIKKKVMAEIENPFSYFDAIYLIQTNPESNDSSISLQQLKTLGIEHRIRRLDIKPTNDINTENRIQQHREVLEEAFSHGLENVMVIETETLFPDDTLPRLATDIQKVKQQNWSILGWNNNEPKTLQHLTEKELINKLGTPSSKMLWVAYHHSIFEQLSRDLSDIEIRSPITSNT